MVSISTDVTNLVPFSDWQVEKKVVSDSPNL